jgi:hypothetical protein
VEWRWFVVSTEWKVWLLWASPLNWACSSEQCSTFCSMCFATTFSVESNPRSLFVCTQQYFMSVLRVKSNFNLFSNVNLEFQFCFLTLLSLDV